MNETSPPGPIVGGSIDDRCRPCKAVTRHTVMAIGADGVVARVICGSCGSQHNYRGGEPAPPVGRTGIRHQEAVSTEPFPLVSELLHGHLLKYRRRWVTEESVGILNHYFRLFYYVI